MDTIYRLTNELWSSRKNRVDISFCFSFIVLLDEFGKASAEAAKADAKVVLDDGMWNR